MKRDMQEEFYKALAHRLTAKQKEKRISIAQIARRSGVQFNTVRAVMEGKHFYFHQVIWIAEMLDVSIDELLNVTLKDLRTIAIKGLRNGEEESNEEEINQKENKQEGIESFF